MHTPTLFEIYEQIGLPKSVSQKKKGEKIMFHTTDSFQCKSSDHNNKNFGTICSRNKFLFFSLRVFTSLWLYMQWVFVPRIKAIYTIYLFIYFGLARTISHLFDWLINWWSIKWIYFFWIYKSSKVLDVSNISLAGISTSTTITKKWQKTKLT